MHFSKYFVTALMALALLFGGPAFGSQRGTVVIDARSGMTPEILAEYQRAVLGASRSRHHRAQVRVLVAARSGFDPGILRLPRARRSQVVHVTIVVVRGRTLIGDITVNAFEVDPRRTRLIRNLTRIR